MRINPTVSRPRKEQTIYRIDAHDATIAHQFKAPSDSWAMIETFNIYSGVIDEETGERCYLRPLIVAGFSGLYPNFLGCCLGTFKWYKCDPDELHLPMPISEKNLYKFPGMSLEETDKELREIFNIQWDTDKQYWDELVKHAWEKTQSQSNYRVKSHNYITDELGLKVEQILKCTVQKGKIYVSYRYITKNNEVKKGATILSQRKLDDAILMEEKHFTFVPILSEFWSQDPGVIKQGYMIFDGYKILVNGSFKGYVVPYSSGYVFVEKCNNLLKDREEIKPVFKIDMRDYKYDIADNIYDAYFSVLNENGRTDVSSSIFVDKLNEELNKAAKSKGFAQHVAKKERLKKPSKELFDAFGNPTKHNEAYQYSGINVSEPEYIEAEEEIEEA